MTRTAEIRRVLIIILVFNLIVATAKITWGMLTNSVSMAADGFHSTLDAAANVAAIIGIAIAARPPDEDHHYGHQRYKTLVTLGIAALMTFGAVEIVQQAVGRLQSGAGPRVETSSFVVMLLTLCVNVSIVIWERRKARQLSSDLLAADAKHTMSDVLVSIGVIGGLIGVRLGYQRADALVSLAIAAIIVWVAWTIARDSALLLADATPHDPREIMAAVLATPQVETAHKLRVRSAGGHLLVAVDITVDPLMRVHEGHEVASAVEKRIRQVAGSDTQTQIHVEPAVPPHTRPDRLFGDVQAELDAKRDDGELPAERAAHSPDDLPQSP